MMTRQRRRRLLLLALVGLALALSLPGVSGAQRASVRAYPKLESSLARTLIASDATFDPHGNGTWTEVLDHLPSGFRLRTTADEELRRGLVRVVIRAETSGDAERVRGDIQRWGGTVEAHYQALVQALVPVPALAPLSRPAYVRLVRAPWPKIPAQGSIVSEGVEEIGAHAWQQAGFSGQGIKIGIEDRGFKGYRDLTGSELPPSSRITTRSFQGDGDLEADKHGTAVAEIIHDIAPEARFYLSTSDTMTGVLESIEWQIEQDVDVLNTSWGAPTGCRDPEDGHFGDLIRQARKAGVLWVTAAGNEAQRHWSGEWHDAEGDERLNFTDEDNGNDLRLDEGDDISVILQWGDGCTPTANDYDLYLIDDEGGEVVSSKNVNESIGPFEAFSWKAPEAGVYGVQVRRRSDAEPVRFHLTVLGAALEHRVPQGSIGFFEPANSPHALTVGAVISGNLRLARYSSRGPTPDGRIKPDVCAPTHVATDTYGALPSLRNPGFTGTSAAAPHTAGAAALVAQAFPDDGPDEIQGFLERRAEDKGPAGEDNECGAGLLAMGPPPSRQAIAQSIVLRFEELTFANPTDWQRHFTTECFVYTNVSDAPSELTVTRPDGTQRAFTVAPEHAVTVCGAVVHIEAVP